MTQLPLDATGHRPAFFDPDGVDQLVSMVVELATELWVVRERVYALEAVAEEMNLPLRRAIENFKPNAELPCGLGFSTRSFAPWGATIVQPVRPPSSRRCEA